MSHPEQTKEEKQPDTEELTPEQLDEVGGGLGDGSVRSIQDGTSNTVTDGTSNTRR